MDLSRIDLPTEVVRTPRLVLRPFRTGDADTASQAVARRAGCVREGVLRSYVAHRDGRRGDAALISRLPTD